MKNSERKTPVRRAPIYDSTRMRLASGAGEFSFCKPSVTKNVLSWEDTLITKTMKQIFGRTALFFLGNLILRFFGDKNNIADILSIDREGYEAE
jgi:hypothetical protein